MKILRFNELKASTYWNAAEKLRKLGHKKRTDKIKKWASGSSYYQAGFDINDFEFNCYIIKEHLKMKKLYKTEEEFVGTVKADFQTFPWDMIFDNTEEGENPYISVFFTYKGWNFMPFGIKVNDNGEVEVEKGVECIDETNLEKIMPEEYTENYRQHGYMKFSNRKDAVRFLKLWNHPATREEFDKFFEENEATGLKENIVKMFSELKVNQLYTEEE